MEAELARRVAETMEADPRLLPVLPELLSDLEELGAHAATVVSVLRAAGAQRGARALDLGCGKGAVAIALARDLGAQVEGLDAMPAFVEAARTRASAAGLGGRCRFRCADVRELEGTTADHDVVLLLALGAISGDHARTVAGYRGLARPGGLLVLDDACLAEGADRVAGYEAYAGLAAMRRRLTAHGDVLEHEVIRPAAETRRVNQGNTRRIRVRAAALRARRPDLAGVLDAYVARQERETRILGDRVLDVLWVLRRT